jgi:hypothetical protein
MLTANHVGDTSHVTFDGSTFYARDTAFTPRQIAGSNVDMKLIKLIDDPGLNSVSLNTNTSIDVNAQATLIGWGVGRDTSVADLGTGSTNIWTWGNTSTLAKRWGTNNIISTDNISYGGGTYTGLVTRLNRGVGSNEAGATIYDSGSGIFILDGSTWKLAGITTAVQTAGTSTFSIFGDANIFARIASYASQITAAIPDLSVYDDWLIDHGLYNAAALATADTDFDGMPQLLEFALGGDPNTADSSLLPTQQIVDENGASYLEIYFTRPQGLTGISYAAQTTSDLGNWPSDSSGVNAPTLVTNGDGSETVRYRRSLPLGSAEKAFLRIVVSTQP